MLLGGELKTGLGVSGLERSERIRSFRFESEVSGDGLGDLFSDQFDEDEARSACQDFWRESEVLCRDGSSPTSGEQFVGLVDALGLEVAKVGLVQLVQVLAQINLVEKIN